jgi:hypothetical protein
MLQSEKPKKFNRGYGVGDNQGKARRGKLVRGTEATGQAEEAGKTGQERKEKDNTKKSQAAEQSKRKARERQLYRLEGHAWDEDHNRYCKGYAIHTRHLQQHFLVRGLFVGLLQGNRICQLPKFARDERYHAYAGGDAPHYVSGLIKSGQERVIPWKCTERRLEKKQIERKQGRLCDLELTVHFPPLPSSFDRVPRTIYRAK